MNTSARKRPRSRQCICNCKCDLTLFSFPQEDFELHNIWLRNLGLTPEEVSHKTIKSRYSCSNHFEEHSFYPGIIKLRKGAMPTILDCSLNKAFRTNPKLKRSLTSAERESVIEHAKIYPSSADLSKIFNCGRTQICNILRSAVTTNIGESYQLSRRQSDFTKGLGMIVNEWIRQTQAKNYTISNNTIKAVGERVSILLDIDHFRPSTRWINRLINKYKIPNVLEYVPRNHDQIKALIDVTAIEDVIANVRYYLPDCVKEKIDSLGIDNSISIAPSNYNNSDLLYSTNNSLIHDTNSYEIINGIPHPVDNYNPMDVYTIVDSDDDEENNDFNLTSSDDDNSNIKTVAGISEMNAMDIDIKEEKIFDTNINFDNGNELNETIEGNVEQSITNNLEDIVIPSKNNQNNIVADKIPELNILKDHSDIVQEKNNETKAIVSFAEAIEHLRPLEEFALLTSNYRAFNFINNLQEIFKEELTKQSLVTKN